MVEIRAVYQRLCYRKRCFEMVFFEIETEVLKLCDWYVLVLNNILLGYQENKYRDM